MKFLVVDDEKLLVKGIVFNLKNEGYETDAAYNGEDALEMIKNNKYDLVILDIMLPKMNGLEVCRRVREFSNVPIIMLTAKGEDMDKLIGFEYGADDYIAKPFNILELKARIKAILRRIAATPERDEDSILCCGDFTIDLKQRSVIAGDREVELTVKEFDLIAMLMKNPGRAFSRENLLNTVWGYEYPGDIRTVDVHIRRLREKLEPNPAEPVHILTKWGIGYYYKD